MSDDFCESEPHRILTKSLYLFIGYDEKFVFIPVCSGTFLCIDMTEYRNWATLLWKWSVSGFKKPVQCFRCINNVTVKHVDKMAPLRAIIRVLKRKNNAYKWIFFLIKYLLMSIKALSHNRHTPCEQNVSDSNYFWPYIDVSP